MATHSEPRPLVNVWIFLVMLLVTVLVAAAGLVSTLVGMPTSGPVPDEFTVTGVKE